MEIPTIKVVHPDDENSWMLINESDFNPATYHQWVEPVESDDPAILQAGALQELDFEESEKTSIGLDDESDDESNDELDDESDDELGDTSDTARQSDSAQSGTDSSQSQSKRSSASRRRK